MAKGKKTGGRAKGSPNKTTALARARIEKADPVGFLVDIMRGKRLKVAIEQNSDKVAFVRPTLDQRVHAAKQLVNKVLPDQKAVELGSGDGSPVIVKVVQHGSADTK